MSASDHLIDQAHRLVQHSERASSLLRIVLEWAESGDYDPISDTHAMRLPGDVVRTIQTLLEPDPEPGGDS